MEIQLQCFEVQEVVEEMFKSLPFKPRLSRATLLRLARTDFLERGGGAPKEADFRRRFAG